MLVSAQATALVALPRPAALEVVAVDRVQVGAADLAAEARLAVDQAADLVAAARLAVDRVAVDRVAATATVTATAGAMGAAMAMAAATAGGAAGGIEAGFSGGHDLAAQDGILTHAFDVRRRGAAPNPSGPGTADHESVGAPDAGMQSRSFSDA